jgi:peptidoglycan/LPS O-acetylase OafA/YrhL
MDYRREIDGLRAIAVLPVILFHAGFEMFSGGFVGVDVFFVISGYLITSIILAEKEAGTFSLMRFYERRARRILPALFVVMAACAPFAWLWLLPNDMEDFSQSLVAVSLFVSNILFWGESGYFDTAAELKPLLHTWSLAVEEQYYVLFPLFIMLTWRLGKRWIAGLLVVTAAISLSLAQWGAYNQSAATFFLLPTRSWELAIGAFIALYFSQPQRMDASDAVKQAASGAGLLLILYGVFAFSKSTPFPSFYALLPTMGAALIILFATPSTVVGMLL